MGILKKPEDLDKTGQEDVIPLPRTMHPLEFSPDDLPALLLW